MFGSYVRLIVLLLCKVLCCALLLINYHDDEVCVNKNAITNKQADQVALLLFSSITSIAVCTIW